MTIDDLLEGDESLVSDWLREKDLLHECDCGYSVYDPDDVSSVAQTDFGDERSDGIFDWACGLADRFGSPNWRLSFRGLPSTFL